MPFPRSSFKTPPTREHFNESEARLLFKNDAGADGSAGAAISGGDIDAILAGVCYDAAVNIAALLPPQRTCKLARDVAGRLFDYFAISGLILLALILYYGIVLQSSLSVDAYDARCARRRAPRYLLEDISSPKLPRRIYRLAR